MINRLKLGRLASLKKGVEAKKKELDQLDQLREKARRTQTNEQAEISGQERKLVKLSAQITEMRQPLDSTAARSDDSLDDILALVREKEQQQRRLEEFEKKRRKEEAKRLAEIQRLKAAEKEQFVKRLKEDRGIVNSIGMKFVMIAGGSFIMGSPADDSRRVSDERLHRVTISKPFYLQTTEVTQGQWMRVMGNNPSYFRNCGDDCPVERVSWIEVQEFIRRLNEMEGTDKYRLPTEAEWEYACRAGNTTLFHTGNCISIDQANYDGNHPMPGCPKGEYRETTIRVGSFEPNSWGLYDMHGNVWEWCQDWYGEYSKGHVIDPTGPLTSGTRVLRGGSWNLFARDLRSANRNGGDPDSSDNVVGFRVARTP